MRSSQVVAWLVGVVFTHLVMGVHGHFVNTNMKNRNQTTFNVGRHITPSTGRKKLLSSMMDDEKQDHSNYPACAIARRDGAWRKSLTSSQASMTPPVSLKKRNGESSALRVLVMGMQSSGASTFLFLLAQIPHSVAVVDLWVGRSAPSPDILGLSSSVQLVLLKATINTIVDVDGYIEQFKPDVSIL
jgi:hypothetical protein